MNLEDRVGMDAFSTKKEDIIDRFKTHIFLYT